MSLQRWLAIVEYAWLATALFAHAAVLAFCLADHAGGATAVGTLAAEILRPVQFALLPLWFVLGPGSFHLRLWAALLFCGLVVAWSGLPYPSVADQSAWLELETAGCLLIWALVLRLSGSRVRHLVGASPLPIQFSIRGLLAATTFAALLVAAGKWVFANVQAASSGNSPDILDLNPSIARAAVAMGLAMISVAAWWAVFRPRRVWLSCLLVAAASGGCGCLMALLLHESQDWLPIGLWWLVHALLIMATLAPLRQMGFRLVAREAASPQPTPIQSPQLPPAHSALSLKVP